jgi:Phenylalanyl-tRNA synthetase alpha subunit
MIDQIKQYIEEVKNFHSTNAAEIEEFRIKFLGKKGILNDLFAQFKAVPNEEKKEFGQVVNELKTLATEKATFLKTKFRLKVQRTLD